MGLDQRTQKHGVGGWALFELHDPKLRVTYTIRTQVNEYTLRILPFDHR